MQDLFENLPGVILRIYVIVQVFSLKAVEVHCGIRKIAEHIARKNVLDEWNIIRYSMETKNASYIVYFPEDIISKTFERKTVFISG